MNQTMKYWKQAVAGALCLLTLAGCAGQSGGGTMSQPESSSELSLGDGPIRIVRSDKNPLPWQSETTYEYLGLRFFLPEEFQAGIEDGSLYLQREALYNSDDKTRDQFYYAYQYLQYIPEDCEDMEYAVDWNAWLDTTERIGAVGAYRADYLEEHPIETFTGCSENKEIGRSEDGQLIYYISVAAEDHAELGELWQSMEVELIEVSPYVQAPDCPDFFDVFDTARNLDALNFLGDFHAQDLDGNSVDTSVFHDYKLTMVNVMTTWCSSCIAELPDLAQLSGEVSEDGVQILTIVADTVFDGAISQEAVELSKKIRESAGVGYPMLIPDDVLLNGRLKGINAYPETFFVDGDGNIVGSIYYGAKSLEEWREIINEELAGLSQGSAVSMGGGTVAMG